MEELEFVRVNGEPLYLDVDDIAGIGRCDVFGTTSIVTKEGIHYFLKGSVDETMAILDKRDFGYRVNENRIDTMSILYFVELLND